jgi:SAM-dependent methyltransferase
MVTGKLESTGERYLPFSNPIIYDLEIHYEHLHRYYFASRFVRGKEVLDLGCGEGYGSNILSKYAKYVIGIDYDKKIINHASRKYRKRNLKFIQALATNISDLNGKKFDVIVCFETIEHLEDHDILLSEIRNVLKNTGILIISTPDKRVYGKRARAKRQPSNIYHKKELSCDEFAYLLRNKFKHVSFFGQNVYSGSQIWPLANTSTNICNEYIVKRKENEFSLANSKEKEPIYLIAIVSNRRLDKSQLFLKSYLTDSSNTIEKRISFLEKQNMEQNLIIKRVESHFGYRIYKMLRNILQIK